MYKQMVHMPSLENWEWGLKIFDGAPTLTTHMNHLLFTQYTHTHTHTQNLHVLTYIFQQTTHLHEARVNVKMAHAAVVVTLIPPPWEVVMLKIIIMYQQIPLVVTFLEWINNYLNHRYLTGSGERCNVFLRIVDLFDGKAETIEKALLQ